MILGKSRWQEPKETGQITSTVKSREQWVDARMLVLRSHPPLSYSPASEVQGVMMPMVGRFPLLNGVIKILSNTSDRCSHWSV